LIINQQDLKGNDMNRSQIILGIAIAIGLSAAVFVLLKKEMSEPATAPGSESLQPSGSAASVKTTELRSAPSASEQAIAGSAKAAPERKKLGEGGNEAEQNLTDEDLKLIASAKAMFENPSKAHDEQKLEMIENLFGVIHPDVVGIVVKALNEENEEIRLAAVELLEEFESEIIVPAVEKALDDKNVEIRETAVNALLNVDSPDATNLLVKGVNDRTPEVREAVFDVLDERPAKIKESVFEKAIHSKHTDVRERVVEMIVDIPSHKVMDILISGMKTDNEEMREEVANVISFFVSEDFETHDEAKEWWEQNKDNFDEELFEK
jgi:hypothetical protein